MSRRDLQPDQVRQCRERLRLSQPKFGERIGVGRVSVYQYEHGRRHDTQQPITISQTVNMACGAAWLGIDGYTAVLAAAEKAYAATGDSVPVLPRDAIEPWHKEAAEQELESRGFKLAEHRLAFPLLITLALWSQIGRWCAGRGIQVPTLHPVISARVPGIAILEFAHSKDEAAFVMYCLGPRDGGQE